jgi:hypothetical protein
MYPYLFVRYLQRFETLDSILPHPFSEHMKFMLSVLSSLGQ